MLTSSGTVRHNHVRVTKIAFKYAVYFLQLLDPFTPTRLHSKLCSLRHLTFIIVIKLPSGHLGPLSGILRFCFFLLSLLSFAFSFNLVIFLRLISSHTVSPHSFRGHLTFIVYKQLYIL